MRSGIYRTLVAGTVCLALAQFADAAAEVSLHEANTSVGLQPINATNKWKLITDPTDPNTVDYYELSGSLDNTWDSTKLQLATNAEGQYTIGDTVVGLGIWDVTQFTVPLTTGGYETVSLNAADPSGPDNYSYGGGDTEGGTDKGEIDDVEFSLDPDDQGAVKDYPSNMDWNNYQINLVDLGNPESPPTNYNPGLAMTFASDSTNMIVIYPIPGGPADGDGAQTILFGDINPSATPEPASFVLLGIGAAGLLVRRRARLASLSQNAV